MSYFQPAALALLLAGSAIAAAAAEEYQANLGPVARKLSAAATAIWETY